jgi:hypothetical protein
MRYPRLCLLSTVALFCSTALVQAQTAAPRSDAQRTATAPGVTRAVEHPDTTVDQTQPDSRQPETASDPQSSGPATAKDSPNSQPETATDAPKPSAEQKAAEQARKGVRSNTLPAASSPPPASPPGKPHN